MPTIIPKNCVVTSQFFVFVFFLIVFLGIFFHQMSDLSVTWSVASERDGVSEKKWDEDDMEATRTVLVLGVDKLDSFIERLKSELAQ